MTRISEGFTFLLYMHAQGTGIPPNSEDITEWNGLRKISRLEEIGNPESILDRSFSRIDELDPRRPIPGTRWQVGIRHMTGTEVINRNFQVLPVCDGFRPRLPANIRT